MQTYMFGSFKDSMFFQDGRAAGRSVQRLQKFEVVDLFSY